MLGEDDITQKGLTLVFSALGNPIRLKILSIITETARPLHIKAVAQALQMDYAAVYRHVDVLRRAGLVQIFEVGRSRVLSPLHTDLIREMLLLAQKIEHE